MPELGSYGSVRGARGNSRPYRESDTHIAKLTSSTQRGPAPAKLTMPVLRYMEACVGAITISRRVNVTVQPTPNLQETVPIFYAIN